MIRKEKKRKEIIRYDLSVTSVREGDLSTHIANRSLEFIGIPLPSMIFSMRKVLLVKLQVIMMLILLETKLRGKAEVAIIATFLEIKSLNNNMVN